MLLDTAGLLCLYHRAKPLHDEARVAYKAAPVRLTHNYVLAEFVALTAARRLPRMAALTFLADLLANPDIETLWVDEELHQQGMELLLACPDKTCIPYATPSVLW